MPKLILTQDELFSSKSIFHTVIDKYYQIQKYLWLFILYTT